MLEIPTFTSDSCLFDPQKDASPMGHGAYLTGGVIDRSMRGDKYTRPPATGPAGSRPTLCRPDLEKPIAVAVVQKTPRNSSVSWPCLQIIRLHDSTIEVKHLSNTSLVLEALNDARLRSVELL